MPWTEEKRIDRLNKYNSTCTLEFNGMHIQLRVVCRYHSGSWKWLLYCDKFGISDVFIGTPKSNSKDEIKKDALKNVRATVRRHLNELDLDLKGD